jgi:hypothetical protein
MQLSAFREGNSLPVPPKYSQMRETSFSQDTQRPVFAKTFPNSLSEMGRQNGNVAPMFAAHARSVCATRRNCFIPRRLVRFARLLRCVYFDAAMHNRNSGTSSANWIRFLNRTSAASTCAIDARRAVVFSNIVHDN